MHGGPKTLYKNQQHEKAMASPINESKEDPEDIANKLREKGLI